MGIKIVGCQGCFVISMTQFVPDRAYHNESTGELLAIKN